MSSLNAASPKFLVAKALKAEQEVSRATTHEQAFQAAVDVVENYMKALSLVTDSKERQPLDAKCREWFKRAEEIKGNKDWQAVVRMHEKSGIASRFPKSTRKLTTREEIILLESAKLNGFIFPPWKGVPAPEDFELGEGLFTDKPDLRLSNIQKSVFACWERPLELLSRRAEDTDDLESILPVMSVPGPTDLVQDMLTDCSVVASLCAATARSERGIDKHHLPIIFPCEYGQVKPRISPCGKYIFRFYFNGCFRKVVIDDRLPASKTSRSLHVVDMNHPNYLWPALVEKAYLKLRGGGYGFPGSNSGTDLWVLTGWIPEQVFLHHDDVTAEQLWRRLFKRFCNGDVLLTVGTGKLTEREQKELGFVGEHDYAILDMREVKDRRQMLVKNPWAGDDATAGDIANSLDPRDAHTQASSLPRTYWMDSERVLQNFENLYLNWNPGIFQCREDIHFTWDLSTARSVAGCFAKNPQFAVTSEAGGTVWLLLGKHFKTVESEDLLGDSGYGEEPGFISIYVFKANGKRVALSEGALHRGPYVDSPNTLMRLELPPGTTYTAVISEQSLPTASQNFTLSALSNNPILLAHAENQYSCLTKTQGSWTSSTAGGNAESARYSFNPQFTLEVHDLTDISILLEPSETELATHVKLFWSKGQRVTRVRSRDIITDSGDYRRGGAFAEKRRLDEGVYTIVCSTFAPDQLGRFTLWVSSSIPCNVKPLAPEAAGRRTTISDLGILTPGKDRMLAPLATTRLTRVKLIGRSRQSTIGNRAVGPSPMLMTVELGQGPYKEVLATSEDGTHSDAISGVRIEDFNLHPGLEDQGGAWIVIERIGGPGGQVEDHFEIEALAEEKVQIGEWIVEEA